MKNIRVWISVVATTTLFAGCQQYQCYDGTYVQDAYDCSNHGGLSYYRAPLKTLGTRKASSAKTVAGNWMLAGTYDLTKCLGMNGAVQTPITFSLQGYSLTAQSSRYGVYRTSLKNNRARFTGTKKYLGVYTFNGNMDVKFSSLNAGTVNGTIETSLLNQKPCAGTFSGIVTRKNS